MCRRGRGRRVRALSVTLTNTSGATLQLGGYSIQGDFTESDRCGTSLAAGASCTLTVRFLPTARGQRTGTLSITDNSGAATQFISLEGFGGPQGLTLSPPLLNFGVDPIGQTSAARTATLANNTGQAVTGIAITSSGEFNQSNNCGTAVANGASCTLQITVTPQTLGAITGAISISSAGLVTPLVRLAGHSPAETSSGNAGVVAVLAYTTTEANAAAQLAFVAAPAPSVTSGGNAGSYVTVEEDDSGGNPVLASDTVTITVTGPGGYDHSYTAAASNGVATFDLASDALTVLGNYNYTATVASNTGIRRTVAAVTVTGGATISAAAGGGQSAVINERFAIPLQLLVTDGGNHPLSGTVVTYTAPATGASAGLSTATAITGSNGTASVTATANGRAGSYVVTAAVTGGTAASFPLTNAKATPAIAWATPAAIPQGIPLTATQLDASAGGVAGTFVYTPAAGTVLSAGPQTLSVSFTPTDTADYNTVSASVVLAVNAASAVSVSSSSPESMLQGAVTFTATVSAPRGTPTGTVTFADGTAVLGSAALSASMAVFTSSSLPAGSHAITAIYSGDAQDAGATSAALAQLVIDFSLKSSSVAGPGQSVLPGGSATYTVAIAPTAGTAFPVPAVLTVSGLPAGATAALTTAPWARLTGTSWQLPSNTVLTDVSLTFTVPPQVANAGGSHVPRGPLPPLLWGVLLLPFVGKLRRGGKRIRATIFRLGVLAAVAAAIAGCGSGNGFFGQQPKTYTMTVTVTAGALSHSTNLTLTVQ